MSCHQVRPIGLRRLLLIAGVFGAIAFGIVEGGSSSAWAAGKKKHSVPSLPVLDGKKVISVRPVDRISIEMPDRQIHNFGTDFELRIWKRLKDSEKFVVVTEGTRSLGELSMGLTNGASPAEVSFKKDEYEWNNTFVPAATLRVNVEAMSFTTGSRGERTFYGFDDRFYTPFNDGHATKRNEFPLRKISFEPNWFDRTFEVKGLPPFDSTSGLDLGDGLNVNVLFAWLDLKYALYDSRLSLRLEIDAPLAGRHEYRLIEVRGKGYFFDVAGAYKGFSAGISVARRDAMLQAFYHALDGSYSAVERAVADLPLTGRIDGILPNGELLLGTGFDSQVRTGIRYQVVDAPGVVIEVIQPQQRGALGRVVAGDAALAVQGSVIRQITASALPVSVARSALTGGPVIAAAESVELPWVDFPKSNFNSGEVPDVPILTAFARSIAGTFTLPYRIWRYFTYDQAYHKVSDGQEISWPDGSDYKDEEPRQPVGPREWAQNARGEAWARQIGLAGTAPEIAVPSEQQLPVVAIIDSGMDYNHPSLHGLLWLNPAPIRDSRGRLDRYGWDFVSGDSRPFDDGYHGTQMASAVTAVNAGVRIMSLKAFNPWGITSSAALYASFVYAVDHGAKIILCGWATRQYSEAIEMGVAYARQHGAIVVAAAGDRGDDLKNMAAYPAVLSAKYDNVVTVTHVNVFDALVQKWGKYSNYAADYVTIAAPGDEILVAEPRNSKFSATSSGVAAAIVAGALSRIQARDSVSVLANAQSEVPEQVPPSNYGNWIAHLKVNSDSVPALSEVVQGGLRLRIVE